MTHGEPASGLGAAEASRHAPAAGETPVHPRRFRSALVIANPIAGRGRAERVARALAEGLAGLGLASELYLTSSRGDGKRRAAACGDHVDLVIAVGGDGTMGEVLAGLDGRDATVGLVPFGTANLLATEFRLPRDVEGTLAIVARGRTVEFDSAAVDGEPCYCCLGVGIDGLAVRELERRRTGAIFQWTYLSILARVLVRYRAPELRVTVDGRELPGRYGFVLVSNLGRYAAHLRLAEHARTDDGRFEVYAVPRADTPRLFALAAQGYFSRLPGRFGSLFEAGEVTVESDVPVPYQVDGDFGGETPVALSVRPQSHRLLVP